MNDAPWEPPPLITFEGIDFGDFVPRVMIKRFAEALCDPCVDLGTFDRALEAFRGVIAQAAAQAICDGALYGHPPECLLAIENAAWRAFAKMFEEADNLAAMLT